MRDIFRRLKIQRKHIRTRFYFSNSAKHFHFFFCFLCVVCRKLDGVEVHGRRWIVEPARRAEGNFGRRSSRNYEDSYGPPPSSSSSLIGGGGGGSGGSGSGSGFSRRFEKSSDNPRRRAGQRPVRGDYRIHVC